MELKKKSEQYIDTISQDVVLSAGWDQQAKEQAKGLVDSFQRFIEDNKDEITALQILYSIPYGKRHVSYEQIEELVQAVQKPPYGLTTARLWQAYQQLEKSRVKRAPVRTILADMVSLVRFALGKDQVLEPFSDVEQRKYESWLSEQKNLGRDFTPEQILWLNMIKDHIATSLSIRMEDFQYPPFHEQGGSVKVYNLFGDDLNKILAELNEVLAA